MGAERWVQGHQPAPLPNQRLTGESANMGKARISVKAGDKFNRLTVIREIESRSGWKGHAVRRLEARCDCGDIRGYDTKNIYNGNTGSCGCFKKTRIRETNIERCSTHNMSYTRLYGVWTNINHRCGMGVAEGLPDYAGRGIDVCDSWRESFEGFRDWALSHGYKQGLQIDRKDNDKGYSPSNCRFVSAAKNMINRRNSLIYHIDGKVYQSVREAAQDLGVSSSAIRRKCSGYRKRGKQMPAKPNCWTEKKYKDANHVAQSN